MEGYFRDMTILKWMLQINLTICVLLLCSVLTQDAGRELICQPDFTLHDVNTTEGVKKFCANIFVDRMTWDSARVICRITYSHLTHKIHFNSSLYSELIEKDVNFIWVGIRRRSDFFIVESTADFFKEKAHTASEYWGAHWSANVSRQDDCVALNLSSGSLHLYDCNSQLPFVCDNRDDPRNKSKEPICPETMSLSYPLSTSGKKCVSFNTAQSQMLAEEFCEETDGRLATTEEYDVLYAENSILPHTSEDTAYWANTENHGSCVFKIIPGAERKTTVDRPENCSKPLPFICVKDFETELVEVRISPEKVQSFPSTSTCTSNPDLLVCNVKVNGRQLSGREKKILYQWYKDDLPILVKHHVFRMSHFVDPLRRNPLTTSVATRQGSYHCEVRILGSSKSFRSPKLEFYYSDISTYVINIHGIAPDSYADYSQHDFPKFINQFESLRMFTVMSKVKSRYQQAEWDFQKISMLNGVATMQILIYVYRTKFDELEDEKTYQFLKDLFQENHSLFAVGGNVSFEVNSADVCFNKDSKPSDTCESILRWPTSTQASNVITNPLCLDEKKRLVQRKCRANNMNKAEWSSFNCSSCKTFQPSIQDLELKCPTGYMTSKSANLCFRIYHIRKSWSDANKICTESSSYMLTEIHEEINPLTSIWLSYKYSYGKIQQLGLHQKHEILKDFNINEGSPEHHCVSAHLEDEKFQLRLENCSERLSFVCIYNPFEMISSVKFSNTWYKQNTQKPCYFFAENDAYNWQEARRECQEIFQGSSLLKESLNLDDYQNLKMLIPQLYQESECRKLSWWMDMKYVDGVLESSDLKYVDWYRHTNFDLRKASGILSLFPGNKLQWSLEEIYSKLRYICEMSKCDDIRPTEAYIEDRSRQDINPSADDYFVYLRNFNLKCIPSGWYITQSMRWYKDGIRLNLTSNNFSFDEIPSITTLQESLQYQGYYWCSVDQMSPIRRTFSSKVLLKLPGIHTFVFSLESQNKKYLSDCVQYMTSELFLQEYENTTTYKCLYENLKLPLTVYHFYLRNITCNNSTHTSVLLHVHFKEEESLEEEIFKQIENADYSTLLKNCDFKLSSITSRSTVACYGEKKNSLTWPTTPIGETAFPEELCLTDQGTLLERKCLGDFNIGASWSDVPVAECSSIKSKVTEELHELLQHSDPAPFALPEHLVIFTSSPEELLPADVQMSTEILVNYADQPSFAHENLYPVIQAINNLIDVPEEVLLEAANSSNQVIESFEHIASTIDIEGESIKIAAENLAVSIHPLNSGPYNIPNCALLKEWTKNITTLFNVSGTDLKNNINDSQAGIVLPTTLVAENLKSKTDRVIFIIRQNFNYVNNSIVVGPVIQVAFKDKSVYDVNPPVEMFFKLYKTVENYNMSSLKCVFWDQRLNDNFGGWSYKGCFLNKLDNGRVTCSCNHLTSFTVILELNPMPVLFAHKTALTLITYIGCSLSCFGLGMIILTFIFFRDWRKSVKNKALFNLSASLISFLVLFMAGIDKTSSKDWCLIISVLLHYLLLTSFAWMLVSAFMMYLSLVKVFATYIPCLIQKAMLFAYGTPAVIVIVILGYKYELYAQENYCWLSHDIFYYAIASPILLMLAANFIIFATILFSNTCMVMYRLRSNQDHKKLAIAKAKALFCISVLLGLSWIFGFLAIGKAKVIFQYLFAITTTLQGFLVFIFFIVRQKAARDLWKKYLFPSSSDKSRISHITGSTFISNRVYFNRDTHYENLFKSIIIKPNSPYI